MRPITTAVLALSAALALPGGVALAGTNTITFSTEGEHRIVIPSGVTTLHVIAVGGFGAIGYMDSPGGRGARVEGDLAVSPGMSRYLLVGGNGTSTIYYASMAGGGGGASDVRTLPAAAGLSPDPRVLIAGGGGGGGQGYGTGASRTGGAGGDAGAAGQTSQNCPTCSGTSGGGAAGVPVGTGAGGPGGGANGSTSFGQAGGAGALGAGGPGAYSGLGVAAGGFNGGGTGGDGLAGMGAGGGGGGGLNGGGGGGGTDYSNAFFYSARGGGGGGGGSSLLPPGGTSALDTTGLPLIRVSFSDSTAPVVGLDQPPALSNDPTTLTGSSGTVLGDGDVTVKVYAGPTASGSPVRTIVADRDPATGAYSAAVTSDLPDGQYTARASQVDGAGNGGTSAARTFAIDRTAPSVSITAPAHDSWTSDATPELTGIAGTGAGESATIQVEISKPQGVVQTLSTQRNAATGAFAVTPSPALADGTYLVRARQTDTAGNTGESPTRWFTIDTTAPAPSLTAPAAGSRTADATPTFGGTRGSANGDSGAVVVDIYPGSSPSGTAVATLNATAGQGSSYTVDAAAPLPDGTYTARASQADSAANVGTSPARTFTVDTTGPVVKLTQPSAGGVAAATPVFAGIGGTAPGDGAQITVRVFAGSAASGTIVQTLSATRAPGTGGFGVPAAFALADGTYTARATQADDVGNATASTAVTFKVSGAAAAAPAAGAAAPVRADRTAPVLSRLRLSKLRFRPGGKGAKLRYTLSEPAIVTVKITRRGRTRALGTLKRASGAGRDSLRFSGRLKRKALKRGRYLMTITATDTAGNRSASRRISFRIM